MSENQQNNSNEIAGALPLPNRDEGNVQPVPVQPRQPENLQGLLRFAMDATRAEDAPSSSDFVPMDEQRRQFLEEALTCLTVDMSQVIHMSIEILSDTRKMREINLGDELPRDVQEAFYNLLELVDDMDVANDFYKMGGFSIFPHCFGSENEKVRAMACTVLGEACQNNPYCQARAMEAGYLNVLLTLVQSEKEEALTKAIFALSCLCREFAPASRTLVATGGCSVLAALLEAEEPAARAKAAFLARSICQGYPEAREKFVDLNLMKQLAALIKKGRDTNTEQYLHMVISLLEATEVTVVRQFVDPAIGLKKILQDHMNHPDLRDDTFREEKDITLELLAIMATYPPMESVNEEADR